MRVGRKTGTSQPHRQFPGTVVRTRESLKRRAGEWTEPEQDQRYYYLSPPHLLAHTLSVASAGLVLTHTSRWMLEVHIEDARRRRLRDHDSGMTKG